MNYLKHFNFDIFIGISGHWVPFWSFLQLFEVNIFSEVRSTLKEALLKS